MRRPETGVAGDENALTSREMDVLRLVALGWSNERIGDELGVTLNTGCPASNYICRLASIKFCRFTSMAWPRCWAALVR